MIALAEIDFAACLQTEASAAQQAVAVKFAEACLRLRAGLKQCASSIFRALQLTTPSEYHCVWPTLLALEHTDSAPSLLRPTNRQKGGKINKIAEDASGESPPPSLKSLPAA